MNKIIIMLLLSLPVFAQADLVVVTGNNSSITSLTESEARQLFSGQLKAVAGQRVQPLDLPSSTSQREEFYRKLMGRSPDQMRAYWTRLIFTGQGKPPREVANTQELTSLVRSGNYIGYLPADAATAELRILFRVQ